MKHNCILLSILLFVPFFSYSSYINFSPLYDFSVGDFTFKYKGRDEVELYSYTGHNDTVIIPETVVYESISYKIISIARSAFYKKPVEYASIPNSVVKIGADAFASCRYLTSVEIPFGVIEIEEGAFGYCSGLKSIKIPASVKYIGPRVFSKCPNLEEIKIAPDSPYLYYDSGILYNKDQTVVLVVLSDLGDEVHLPESVTRISSRAFSSLGKIPSIIFPPDLKSIEKYAFWGCRMDSIVFTGTKLDSIGENSFERCYQLQSVCFPEGLKYIGSSAFSKCEKLCDITFPSSLEVLGSRVFAETPWFENQPDGEIYISDVFYMYKNPLEDLTSVTIREGTKAIAGSAFAGCSNLQTVTLPEGLKLIGEYAFSRCKNLESINSTDGITYLGEYAFSGCHKLKSILLSDSLQRIEYSTFTGCINLKSVTLSPNINYIGDYAFSGCNSIKSIVVPDKVTYIGSYAFSSEKLRYFNIPEAITGMGTNPFRYTKWYKKQKKGPVYKGKVFLDYKLRKNKRNAALSLKIEEGTEIIAEKSLDNCRNFKKMEIPPSVFYIGFSNINKSIEWEELVVHWENPSEVVIDDPFISYLKPVNCILRVPKNTSQQYKSLYPWKYFYIVEAE